MHHQAVALVLLTAAAIAVAPAAVSAADGGSDWQRKVDPWVVDTATEGTTEFLVFLAEQADLSGADRQPDKLSKATFVFETLTELAKRTQGPLLEVLDARGVAHRPYWVANMVWVRGDLATVQAVAERSDVARVSANPAVRLELPLHSPSGGDASPETVEWNIAHVNAPDVWALGITGGGAVVAGQDTGYLWNHPALVDQYRGGPAGNHDYNWWDAIHSGGGSCGANSPVPCDDHGHGTHTMGTIVGDDGLGNQVGMAPGARWIGCRNMNQGVGTPATYAECYQFFIAPTDLGGANPDPAMAPDVINNSWGCPPSEGCTDPNVLLTVVQNVRAAGIVTVHSAGNDGSSCGSVSTPSAIYAESFSVGATSSSDAIASFSSRGPVTVDGSNRLKPDISAPGVSIRSSTRDGGYEGGWSGTSMAGPHVAGLVALLISANPGLAGNVDLIEEVVEQTAVPLTSSQGCGGSGPTDVPNNVYGWGRIDALAAVGYPLDFRLAVVPEEAAVCAPADAVFDVAVSQLQGFSEPVALTVAGLPPGAGASFSVNPVTPPGASVLTVSGTALVAAGSHPFQVVGTSSPGSIVHDAPATVTVFDAAPAAPAPVSPANLAHDVSLRPVFEWSPVAQAAGYLLEVAGDPLFATIVATEQSPDPTATLGASLEPLTEYFWRVRAGNACGDSLWSAVFSFTTRPIPPVLLVDDDDNSPDVRTTYTTALTGLGVSHDLWDTVNSDNEPTAADLEPYQVVVWFTGDEFGGAAGPGAAGEAALASWLDVGRRCLLLSSQDYYYDRGLTPFMAGHLGLGSATSDTGQSTVDGAAWPFAGLGPYTLVYPFTNYSDTMIANAAGHLDFTGDEGGAAVGAWSGTSYTSLWGFPWEALPTAADREVAMQAFLDACADAAGGLFADGFESGGHGAWSTVVP